MSGSPLDSTECEASLVMWVAYDDDQEVPQLTALESQCLTNQALSCSNSNGISCDSNSCPLRPPAPLAPPTTLSTTAAADAGEKREDDDCHTRNSGINSDDDFVEDTEGFLHSLRVHQASRTTLPPFTVTPDALRCLPATPSASSPTTHWEPLTPATHGCRDSSRSPLGTSLGCDSLASPLGLLSSRQPTCYAATSSNVKCLPTLSPTSPYLTPSLASSATPYAAAEPSSGRCPATTGLPPPQIHQRTKEALQAVLTLEELMAWRRTCRTPQTAVDSLEPPTTAALRLVSPTRNRHSPTISRRQRLSRGGRFRTVSPLSSTAINAAEGSVASELHIKQYLHQRAEHFTQRMRLQLEQNAVSRQTSPALPPQHPSGDVFRSMGSCSRTTPLPTTAGTVSPNHGLAMRPLSPVAMLPTGEAGVALPTISAAQESASGAVVTAAADTASWPTRRLPCMWLQSCLGLMTDMAQELMTCLDVLFALAVVVVVVVGYTILV